MEAPKSRKAIELLRDPDTAHQLANAIRAARSRGLREFDVALNGKKLVLREAIKADK